jgi:hypothetical protein
MPLLLTESALTKSFEPLSTMAHLQATGEEISMKTTIGFLALIVIGLPFVLIGAAPALVGWIGSRDPSSSFIAFGIGVATGVLATWIARVDWANFPHYLVEWRFALRRKCTLLLLGLVCLGVLLLL